MKQSLGSVSASQLMKAVGLAAAILIPTSLFGGTITVNWDDLPTGNYQPTPAGYGGYNWYFGDSTFGSVGPNDGNHGLLQYNTVALVNLGTETPYSPPNSAYNAWGYTPMRVESLNPSASDEFTFSAWFSGQPDLGPAASEVEVEGFIGTSSTPSFTTIFDLPSNGSWIDEDFTSDGAVNKLLFSPLDASGTPSTSLDGYFWMDNAQLTSVPDQPSWMVTAIAAIAMLAMIRLRRANA